MGYFHGNDGQVTWADLGDQATQAYAWEMNEECAIVDVGVFNTSYDEDLEPGTITRSGTITCRGRDDDAVPLIRSVGVLTLKTTAAAANWVFTGSAILQRIPFKRTKGNNPDDPVYAFRGTGSWSRERVAA